MATRIGVIGCGFYAPNHLNAWAALAAEGATLAAVCDRDAARRSGRGRAFGVPFYTDAAAMLDAEGLDLVDIVTRHETHRPLAELTIGRGVATIVQKPFAPTFEDAAAIVAAAEAAGVWLAVHENFRYAAPMRNIARIVASGAIGTPRLGADRLSHPLRRLSHPALLLRRAALRHRRRRHPRPRRRPLPARRGRRGSPARPSGATRRSAPRTRRPCCSATRAGRRASSSAATRRGATPTPSPRPWSRSRATAARSSPCPAAGRG